MFANNATESFFHLGIHNDVYATVCVRVGVYEFLARNTRQLTQVRMAVTAK